MSTIIRGQDQFRLGLMFAVGSAFTFGMSGPFAKSLMVAGWSPTAAVTARLAGGALVMAAFATIVKPDWLRQARAHARTVVAYGLIPIAGAQLCYYNAVSHLSVGVALLLEYTAPILVVGWVWGTTRRRPRTMTLVGVALAIVGIVLVLNVVNGAHIDAVGVAWGLAAAICAACYFMMSDQVTADGSGLHSITLAAGGLVVGAIGWGLARRGYLRAPALARAAPILAAAHPRGCRRPCDRVPWIRPMAYANVELIQALRRTAARLREGSDYQWGHLGMCNCGQLAQTLTGEDRHAIHAAALRIGGEWEDRVREYCPDSGQPIDAIIRAMLGHGLSTGDLADLEDLSDDRILRRLPSGRRYLERNQRDDVIEYLETWAALLEEQLRERLLAAGHAA